MSDMRLLAQLHDRLNFTVEKSHYDALASLLASTRDIIENLVVELETRKKPDRKAGELITNARIYLNILNGHISADKIGKVKMLDKNVDELFGRLVR